MLFPFFELFLQCFSVYLCFIGSIFGVGLALVLFHRDWGPVAELYLRTVAWVQDCLVKFYDKPSPPSAASSSSSGRLNGLGDEDEEINNNVFDSSASSSLDSFEFLPFPAQSAGMATFEMAIELVGQGIESIVKEDVSTGFRLAPDYRRYELNPFRIPKRKLSISRSFGIVADGRSIIRRLKRRIQRNRSEHNHLDAEHHHQHRLRYRHTKEQRVLRIILFCTLAFRIGALFPVRLAFLLASFAVLFGCCLWNAIRPLAPLAKTKMAVIYCRLYTTGCGFITRFHGTEHRPKRPGVICANHLSPCDVHVIYGDIPVERDYLYLVTGQKHGGLIWSLQKMADKLCPALWLERSDPESRRRFSVQVLEAAKDSGPVILFPEGYCTNNSLVLMFRRAVFQEDVTVYPVAIKQEPRFGDAYWSENNFMHYLFRVLTSWALVYNVYYLAPQQRKPEETPTEFAARVQRLIAARIGVNAVGYDGGGLWYKPEERWKAQTEWKKRCAFDLNDRLEANSEESGEIEETDGTPLTDNTDCESGKGCDGTKRNVSEVEIEVFLHRTESDEEPPGPSASVAMENLLEQQNSARNDNDSKAEERQNNSKGPARRRPSADSDDMDLIG